MTRRIREVRKRDGRVVPFDGDKIADAIHRALRAVGESEAADGSPVSRASDDRSLSRELAAAVEHFFVQRNSAIDGSMTGGVSSGSMIPEIEQIQDVVETVLMELGHSKTAKAYILYRQKRAMLRESLQVRDDSSPSDVSPGDLTRTSADRGAVFPDGAFPDVEESGAGSSRFGISTWEKGRISAALIREAELAPAVAEEIAAAVESRVLRSGLRRISTSLIRELVDNELFERGFDAKLLRHAPVGLPRYDLARLIFADEPSGATQRRQTPEQIRDHVSSRILRQFALAEGYSPEVAHAHRESRIFIHRLEDPLRVDRAIWDLSKSEGGMEAFFRQLSVLEESVGESLHLRGLERPNGWPPVTAVVCGQILDRLLSSRDRAAISSGAPRPILELEASPGAIPWLRALDELDSRSLARVTICFRLDGDLRPDRNPSSRLFTEDANLEEVGECLVALKSRSADLEILAGAGCESRFESVDGFGFSLGKLTLNLPRAAFRSTRRGGNFEAELDDLLDLTVQGLLERRHFVSRLTSHEAAPLRGLARELPIDVAQGELVVGLVGLNECVHFLTGRQLHESDEPRRRAQRILERLHLRLSQSSGRLGARLVLEETRNREGVRKLEEVDADLYGANQGGADQGGAKDVSYSDGVRWHRDASLDSTHRMEELVRLGSHVRLLGGVLEDVRVSEDDGERFLASLESVAALAASSSMSPGELAGPRKRR